MIRILMMICVVTAAAWAAASPSARLAALADDGLLIEDAGADGMWPASVAEHGSLGAFRAHGLTDDLLGMGWDLRRPLGRGWNGRIWADVCPDDIDGEERLMLQAAKKMANVSLGAGAYLDGPVASEPGGSGRRGLQAGLRWKPDSATVFEGTIEKGEMRANSQEDWDGTSDQWRLRGYRDIGRGFIITGGADHRSGLRPIVVHEMEPVRKRIDEDIDVYEFGILFWPDADAQLGVFWVDSHGEAGTSDALAPGRVTRGEIIEEQGMRMSVEVRPSAWFSIRSGFGYFDTTHTYSAPDMDELMSAEERSRVRLGCGASLHAGRFDVNVGWADGPAPAAALGSAADPDDEIIHCELVAHF